MVDGCGLCLAGVLHTYPQRQKNKSRETGIVEKKRGKKERAKRNVLKGKVKAEDYNNGAADCEIENPQKVASNE